MAKSSKVKWDRVIIIALAIIGALTVLDNTFSRKVNLSVNVS